MKSKLIRRIIIIGFLILTIGGIIVFVLYKKGKVFAAPGSNANTDALNNGANPTHIFTDSEYAAWEQKSWVNFKNNYPAALQQQASAGSKSRRAKTPGGWYFDPEKPFTGTYAPGMVYVDPIHFTT